MVTERSTSACACCVWTDSSVASISPPCGGNCPVSANVTVPVSGVVTDTANALPLKVVALSAKAGKTEDAAKSPIIETVRIAKAAFEVSIFSRCLSFNVFSQSLIDSNYQKNLVDCSVSWLLRQQYVPPKTREYLSC